MSAIFWVATLLARDGEKGAVVVFCVFVKTEVRVSRRRSFLESWHPPP